MGSALQYATDDLRSDRKIVMEAVSNSGFALQYVNNELRSDAHKARVQ